MVAMLRASGALELAAELLAPALELSLIHIFWQEEDPLAKFTVPES